MGIHHFARAAALLLIASPWAAAQTVDLSLSPPLTVASVGEHVELQLWVHSSTLLDLDYAAIDAVLDYDPNFLLLAGVDDTLADEPWFFSGFLPEPDGINADLTDGDALYTALCGPGTPATATPAGERVTTLRFIALQETPGTSVSFHPSLGTFGVTEVYDYHVPGGTLTGDISSSATVRIVAPPTSYCLGEPGDCPCSNPGGPGEGCRNSTGAGAILGFSGSTSYVADDLVLQATQLPPSTFGIFIVGGGATDSPFGDGLLCVAPGPSGLHRFSPPDQSNASGVMTRGPGLIAYTNGFPPGQEIQIGTTYYFQAWYRNPAGPCGSGWNMTSALSVVFSS